jgi:hypothetical protein
MAVTSKFVSVQNMSIVIWGEGGRKYSFAISYPRHMVEMSGQTHNPDTASRDAV